METSDSDFLRSRADIVDDERDLTDPRKSVIADINGLVSAQISGGNMKQRETVRGRCVDRSGEGKKI